MGVERHTRGEHPSFDRYGSCYRVPKAEPGLKAASRGHGQVRPVNKRIKRPVAKYSEPENGSRSAPAPGQKAEPGCSRGTESHGQQAVRVGIVFEDEGAYARYSGGYGYPFNSKKHEYRPQEIRQERGNEKNAERGIGCEPFGGKTDSVVAEEHLYALFSLSAPQSISRYAEGCGADKPAEPRPRKRRSGV